MILNCNSCGKKFVVPDNAITAAGRMVQCGSCGNKWKQFPVKNTLKAEEKITNLKPPIKKVKLSGANKKVVKKKAKKRSGPDLYSPEYLAKKHGIKINNDETVKKKQINSTKKVKFGFYQLLIVFLIILISFLRLLYFAKDYIVYKLPIMESYLDYLFETIVNLKDLFLNFFY